MRQRCVGICGICKGTVWGVRADGPLRPGGILAGDHCVSCGADAVLEDGGVRMRPSDRSLASAHGVIDMQEFQRLARERR